MVVHISTGDILREAIAKGTQSGQKARGYLKPGDLLPDELAVAMVAEAVMRALGEERAQ